ncbi:hypothetical protein DXG03_003681 [Asterophora parasitica]|uniref:Fungal lipase-type domain-containing protein n=1 Tax=Asterophora parasitica TaxID=117018 RepID=A0A9P7GAA6_9AGAR|nr:hypothetical protein DXG03_003681 [Asterophora parasitica]
MYRKPKYALTEEQRRMYSLEKLSNFRSMSKVLATRSSYQLTDADLVPIETENELAEIGQFAEIAYSTVPMEFLFRNIATLLEEDFPLEGYHTFQDAIFISSVRGSVAHLPAFVVYRPSIKQLVVATSGTSTVQLALHDMRGLKHRHPSNRGHAHSGFWALYEGIKPVILGAIKKGLQRHDVTELAITGHSMGGAISYLLCMDILSGHVADLPLPPGLSLKLAVFGAPRTGDAGLVKYWQELVAAYRASQGPEKMTEFSIGRRSLNPDAGVPALPPSQLGYQHFAREPFYLDRTRLYRVPSSESEHSTFTAASPTAEEVRTLEFPRGGHNYYNRRDFERLCRRIRWLEKAEPDISGWGERYRKNFAKHHS